MANTDDATPRVGAVLRALAIALRANADVVDALAGDLGAIEDQSLDRAEIKKRYGLGRDALINAADRGELPITRGPRGKLLVKRSALEAWLQSRQYKPRDREPAPDLEAWQRSITKRAS